MNSCSHTPVSQDPFPFDAISKVSSYHPSYYSCLLDVGKTKTSESPGTLPGRMAKLSSLLPPSWRSLISYTLLPKAVNPQQQQMLSLLLACTTPCSCFDCCLILSTDKYCSERQGSRKNCYPPGNLMWEADLDSFLLHSLPYLPQSNLDAKWSTCPWHYSTVSGEDGRVLPAADRHSPEIM